MEYLKDRGSYEIMNNYAKILLEETGEVFTGPEPLKEELLDLVAVLGLLKYKLGSKHPYLSKTISNLPK